MADLTRATLTWPVLLLLHLHALAAGHPARIAASPPGNLVEAGDLNRLGMAHQDMGRYLEAERAYRRVIAFCREHGVAARDTLASALNNLGSVQAATGKFASARLTLERALRLRERSPGQQVEGLVPLLSNLGTVALELEDFAAAEEYYQRSLQINRSTGAKELTIAYLLNNLATLRFRRLEFDHAAATLERAIAALKSSIRPPNPKLGRALINLVAVRIEQGRLEDAEQAAAQAFEALERSVPVDHPDNALLLNAYARLLKKTGRGREARDAKKRAKQIWRENREENLLDHTIDVSALAAQR